MLEAVQAAVLSLPHPAAGLWCMDLPAAHTQGNPTSLNLPPLAVLEPTFLLDNRRV